MLLFLLACGAPPPPPPPYEGLPYESFPDAASAVRRVIASGPRVLGVGEVHATTDGPAVPTTLSRFTAELLPVVGPGTSDLIIETWRLDSTCGPTGEQVVEKVAEDTKRPEATVSDIEALANAAVAMGIRAHDLTITCDEYGTLLGEDGEIAYDRLLELLTGKLGDYAQRGLASADARLILYGGAMHNDIQPAEGLEPYSYGVAARQAGQDGYVELDIYDPALIRGKESLLEPGFAPLLEGATGPDHVLLYTRAPGSFVLLLEERAAPTATSRP